MEIDAQPVAVWRKSSYSNGTGGSCVEVLDGFPGAVPVRDSKDVTRGHIAVTHASWSTFVEALRRLS